MIFSIESARSLKNHEESELWDLASALLHLQNAIFRMEEHEKDPAIIRDLASRAVDAGRELDAVLAVLEEKIVD
jgi:hypothetical protein